MRRYLKIGQRIVEYTLICSRNRKNTLLQALPDDKIRVYASEYTPLRELDLFVKQHLAEIDAAHRRMREAAGVVHTEIPTQLLLGGVKVPVETVKSNICRTTIWPDAIRVETPYESGEEICGQIKHALSEHALKKFRFYLDKWAPTTGKSYGRVTVREQKTRWGSCSSKNNLNFNWKLIMAPEQALEYVVIHELCHLLYFNHSEAFWNEVGRRMPDYGIWKKWLKQHGGEMTLG